MDITRKMNFSNGEHRLRRMLSHRGQYDCEAFAKFEKFAKFAKIANYLQTNSPLCLTFAVSCVLLCWHSFNAPVIYMYVTHRAYRHDIHEINMIDTHIDYMLIEC